MFEPIAEIGIDSPDGPRRIVLARGNLARIAPVQEIDLLVVSALPGDYTPTRSSLIGQLAAGGIDVERLAADKARDLRATTGAWLSQPLEGTGFARLAVFEPELLGAPPEVVGALFRALFPFLDDDRDQTVAMPLIATGDAMWRPEDMLPPLLEAAVEWMRLGLPIDTLYIVARSEAETFAMAEAAQGERARLAHDPRDVDDDWRGPLPPAFEAEGEVLPMPEPPPARDPVEPPFSAPSPARDSAPPGDVSHARSSPLGGSAVLGLIALSLGGPALFAPPGAFGLPILRTLALWIGGALALFVALRLLALAVTLMRVRARPRRAQDRAGPVADEAPDTPPVPHPRPDGDGDAVDVFGPAPVPRAAPDAPNIFLSFSSRDAEAASRIRDRLGAMVPGLEVFDYRRDIEIGVSYQRRIDAALKRSDRALCVMSPDYMASPHCEEELMVARLRNKRMGFAYLWPIYWREVPGDLEDWIRILNYADCREGDLAALDAAVDRLGAALGPSAPETRGP